MEKPTSDEKGFLLERLSSPSFCVKYLAASMRESAETFLMALRNVVDARKGMKKLSVECGLNRESLYRMLSEEGNPRLESLCAVVEALGFKLTIEPLALSAPAPIYNDCESKTVDQNPIGKFSALSSSIALSNSMLSNSIMLSGNSHVGAVHDFGVAGTNVVESGNRSFAFQQYAYTQQALNTGCANYFGVNSAAPKKPPQTAGLNDLQQGGNASTVPQSLATR
jgi:probable addiction module antidote protein